MGLRTGIVGAGIVSQNNHLPAVRRNPRTELTAVVDRDEETLRQATAGDDVARYVDAEEMLEEERLDWVHVATPVQTHFELVSAAIKQGIPALVQKPAAMSAAELVEIQRLSADSGVPVSVVHNHLYYPVVRRVRNRVQAGDIGPVRAVEMSLSGEGSPDETYRGNWVLELPGGDLEEGLPHPFYLLLAFAGFPADESSIDVVSRTVGDYDDVSYDGTAVQYVTDDGTLGSVTVLAESARNNLLRVYGEDGSLTVDIPSSRIEFYDDEAGPYHFLEERLRRNATGIRSAATGLARNLQQEVVSRFEDRLNYHLEQSPDGHYYLINEAAKALEQGKQPPVDLEQSRWVLTLMDQVRESVEGELQPEALR